MRERVQDTIIVGAGIAGLACARRLHDARHPFLMISQNVGGRIQRSRDGAINLGAYYVRADYTHVNRYVRLGRRVDRLAMQRHNADNAYTYWDRRLFLHLPQATRFLRLLVQFRRQYGNLKRRCPTVGQATAIRSDPLLLRLYQQPAQDFIDQHKLGELARWYLAPGLHGTAFAPLRDITAFTLLLGTLPFLVPAYEFTLRLDRLVDGFADIIVPDTVNAISSDGAGYHVETQANEALIAKRVVIATPTDVATRLLGLPSARRPVAAHVFQVAGALREPYGRADIHLFPEAGPTLAIAQQRNGAVLVGSQRHHPEVGTYFTTWRVVDHKHWNPAFHILGDDLLECEQGPNLYLIGDHNIVGLEDAFLTGLYAANRIIISAAGPDPEAARWHLLTSRQN